MATGVRVNDSGSVFAKPDGSPLHPDYYMSQTLERLLKRMDLPRIRLHDLRHTHATLILKEGVPVKVVSERLGQRRLHDAGLPTCSSRYAGRGRGNIRGRRVRGWLLRLVTPAQ